MHETGELDFYLITLGIGALIIWGLYASASSPDVGPDYDGSDSEDATCVNRTRIIPSYILLILTLLRLAVWAQ
eukprot:7587554-Pyramimonas_sp.AAC.1